eukprot:Rmarinus@m.29922
MDEKEDLRSQVEALRLQLQNIEAEKWKAVEEERRKTEANHISKGIPSVPLYLSPPWEPSTKCLLDIREMNIFHVFESIQWDMKAGTFTRGYVDVSESSLRSTRDIGKFVKFVFLDVVAASGLKCEIRTQYILAPTGGHCEDDMLILFGVEQIPFAVVKVTRDSFCDSDHSQLKHYMDLVTAETGVPGVGIITNYFEWRVVWHSVVPSNLLTSTTMEKTMNAVTQVTDSLELLNEDSLSVSPWYGIREEEPETVPKLIYTFLQKAVMLSRLFPVSSRVFPSGKVYWTIANASTTMRILPQPDVTPVPPSAGCALLAAEYILWRPLGSGLHGVVWLAYAMHTYVECAIKLGLTDEETLQNEVHAWHAQGEDGDDVLRQVGTTKLLTAPALVMPYVSPLGEEGLTQDALDNNLKQRVVRLARSGFCHDDLKLHHIGKLPDGRLVLLDFGSLSTNVDEQEAFGKMMSKLQDLVSPAKGATQ